MKPVRHSLAALVSACLFTACGGGGGEPAAPAATPEATATAAQGFIQLEGCVVDQGDRPRATGVHAFSENGRLLANATSNPQGVFVLRVPARQHLSVGLDSPGHESLSLLTGNSNVSVSGCLRESQA